MPDDDLRNNDWIGALRILAWLLGATALLALAGAFGWWYFYWHFTPPWASPPCSKAACPERYRAP
jgi:hypothetical protein